MKSALFNFAREHVFLPSHIGWEGNIITFCEVQELVNDLKINEVEYLYLTCYKYPR